MPFVIFMFVFGWGWKIFHEMRNPPENPLEVHVVAKKWDWRFIYKNGKEVTAWLNEKNQKEPATMVVPAGKPVKLIMSSEKINPASDTDPKDRPVLHSFFVPSARIKQDIVPGRYTSLWFNLQQPGDYWVFCAEFCGTGHSSMFAKINAIPVADFEKWLSSEGSGALTLADKGKALYATKGCVGCHSADGTSVVGPSFKGVWGTSHAVEGGGTVTVDEDYIRESLMTPNAKIVAGFKPGLMPAFAGQLTEDEIKQIIEFIKTLK